MASELDDLLAQHFQEGECVSSGGFTLDPQSALEKIAHFQLPYADAWVLKLAQAAALSGSEFLHIEQTGTDTGWSFLPQEEFSAEEFESNFYNPAVTLRPAADALRSGLWSLGIGKHRPFKIVFPGQKTGYLWNGQQLLPIEQDKLKQTLSLSISHRTLEAGQGLPLIRNIQAALVNSDVLKAITTSLFTLPLEVSVDGRRLDGFQFCPGHGFSEKDHPLELIPVFYPGHPPLAIPPGTRDNRRPLVEEAQPKLRPLSEGFDSAGPTRNAPAAVALITAHAYYQSGKNGGWRTAELRSALFWVKHGVVIQKEEFSGIPAGCVSLALIANADDIPTDLTGFGLQESRAAEVRGALCRALTAQLLESKFEVRLVDRQRHRKLLAGSVLLSVAGMGLNFVVPGAGVISFFAIVGGITVASGLGMVDQLIERDFKKLQKKWSESFPVRD